MGVCRGADVKAGRVQYMFMRSCTVQGRTDRQSEGGNLVFFTERKNEKLDIVCHRDTKMLFIKNCNQMNGQQITDRKQMDGHTRGRPVLSPQWLQWSAHFQVKGCVQRRLKPHTAKHNS